MKDTTDRILAAATRVFARDGVFGATTREIARVAGVNEVTLFRHFRNKNELLRRVVLCFSRQQEDLLTDAPLQHLADLRRTVENYALAHVRKLREHEDFMRTFYAEMHRHPKLCRSIFIEAAKAKRQRFIDYLRAAQKKGLVRKDLDPVTTADALTGMLVSGVLRRPLTEGEYDNDRFTRDCVKLFLRGVQK